jgi:hypothetical protein
MPRRSNDDTNEKTRMCAERATSFQGDQILEKWPAEPHGALRRANLPRVE